MVGFHIDHLTVGLQEGSAIYQITCVLWHLMTTLWHFRIPTKIGIYALEDCRRRTAWNESGQSNARWLLLAAAVYLGHYLCGQTLQYQICLMSVRQAFCQRDAVGNSLSCSSTLATFGFFTSDSTPFSSNFALHIWATTLSAIIFFETACLSCINQWAAQAKCREHLNFSHCGPKPSTSLNHGRSTCAQTVVLGIPRAFAT